LNSPELSQLRKGDAAAYRQLVAAWQHRVYNTVLGLVQHEADAEDVTQEVFVKVYRNISSFKGESKFGTWLYRIAVNAALEHERKQQRGKRRGFLSSLWGRNEAGDEKELAPDFHHPGVEAEKKEQAARQPAHRFYTGENGRVKLCGSGRCDATN
jgi:RNA polymerase sigma factor (sigma-70 family)